MAQPFAVHDDWESGQRMPAPAPVDAELQRIFAERARRLAQPILRGEGDADAWQVLVVTLDGERYAIDSRYVVEVQTTARIVPVPGVGDIWRGVVNLRGRLYATLDLGRFLAELHLHIPSETTPSAGYFVLTRAADLTIALFVDDVQAVRHIAASAVLPPVTDVQEGARTPVIGMTDDLVVLLDVDALHQSLRNHAPATVS